MTGIPTAGFGRPEPVDRVDWAQRAAVAERMVTAQYVRPWRRVPDTALGRARPVGAGPAATEFNYWWQAHLLDVLADAEARQPAAGRRRLIIRVARTIWLRNRGWCNTYHDDMAWLALALPRADAATRRSHRRGERALLHHLLSARDADGLLSWRCTDRFRNVPANATAAIAFARAGETAAAVTITRWILTHLIDAATGLVIDGVQADGHREERRFTYNQGVLLGALIEIDAQSSDAHSNDFSWRTEGERLVAAVARNLAPNGILVGDGGGDGGLFAGICARYLALAAVRWDLATARDLVLNSATAAWAHRGVRSGRFGPDWSRDVPAATGGAGAEADLSVRLSAWLLLEAAHRVTSPRGNAK